MKKLLKNSWLLIFNLIISLILALLPRGLDSRLFDLVPAILVVYIMLPFISGIILILIQNRNKSYEYLPSLLVGACLNNAVIVVVISLSEYFGHTQFYRHFFNFYDFIGFYLPLVVMSLIGGLIGLVIRGTSEQFKKYPNSKITWAFRKIFGSLFISIGALGGLVSVAVFLVLFFNPSSSWLNLVMVDFRLIDVAGVALYYLLLLSVLSIILIPLTFVVILGLMLFFSKKKFFNKKLFPRLIIYFFIWLVIFFLLSFYIKSQFELKKTEMKANIQEDHIDITDFKNIYISRYVKFDDIIIRQGEYFDIVVKGSEYDRIGLDFEKIGKTLNIERSDLETYYNTNTWTVENRDNILFHAGTKHLTIEVTMPDIEKIENEGANIELENLEVDNIEIKLNKRFNNTKGSIKVEDMLRLDAKGGIINLSGSARNLIINSGDCWIEMDKFITENATINAVNTSRLNVNVSNNMEVQTNENSGITNYYNK
ncbi:DUF2807 domain-containing protein [Candidatus Parcubacteria bacterium]|nr:DUF2807 domain-containing protein [Candidatus Parcubacteria bacterium]